MAGYGFASFCYVLGATFLLISALYISPFLCGTPNERKMLKSPTEIHSSAHIEGHIKHVDEDGNVISHEV